MLPEKATGVQSGYTIAGGCGDNWQQFSSRQANREREKQTDRERETKR